MLGRLASLPFILVTMGVGALAMLPMAVHAYVIRDLLTARVFLYSGVFFLVLFAMLAVALARYKLRHEARSHLLGLVLALTVLPAMLAVPFWEALQTTRFVNAWFEMVSSITTTGATLFPEADRLPPTLHLWRATVGWLGGFMMWVAALSVFMPLRLGGFEVVGTDAMGRGATASEISRVARMSERTIRFARMLAPVYGGLTLALWIVLSVAGTPALSGACLAMSTLATSGITAGPGGQPVGVAEAAIFVFLIFGVSRLTFSRDAFPRVWRHLPQDPEVQMAAALLATVPVLLFLRHWWGAYDVADEANLTAGLRALWGGAFTTLSFVTTTGFESAAWADARAWSGLQTPGLVMMGLALVGGGVATTAGGVKLLRIYALFRHGAREMDKLVHPSSVGGSGTEARRLRRQGAFVAWIFFMLFALSIVVTMAALTLTGLGFEAATVLTLAALTTTGPLATVAADPPIQYASLSDLTRLVLAVAMVLGRLELLALIALANPAFWRA
ncbi:TrkH family potassium uptake protein [Rhodobacteraceae bacterium CCMM004]|nr:TrkH family potassium uptake protein [Rhodobacteraceae bacterium CCMM004]